MSKKFNHNNATIKDLTSSLVDKKRELMNLRFRIASKNFQKTHLLSLLKKEIARINTSLNQKKSGN